MKDKTEQEVRIELSQKGWKNRESQNEVFAALGAIMHAQQLRKELK